MRIPSRERLQRRAIGGPTPDRRGDPRRLSLAWLTGGVHEIPKGMFGIVGLLVLIIALFGLYLVSPFFTVGEYERTVVTAFDGIPSTSLS